MNTCLKVLYYSFAILIAVFMNACKSEVGVIITTEATHISPNSALCGGSVNSASGSFVNSKGVYWSTASISKITNKTKYTLDGALDGSFESSLTDLLPSTTYYVRAYAGNSSGIELGNEINFTTLSGILVLSTFDVSTITSTSATCGGRIADNQNTTISSSGICFNTDSLPTTDNSKVVCPISTDSFRLTVTGLIPATTYFVRAFATNSYGTQYGNCVKFKTLPAIVSLSLVNKREEIIEILNVTVNDPYINEKTIQAVTLTATSGGIDPQSNVNKVIYN